MASVRLTTDAQKWVLNSKTIEPRLKTVTWDDDVHETTMHPLIRIWENERDSLSAQRENFAAVLRPLLLTEILSAISQLES